MERGGHRWEEDEDENNDGGHRRYNKTSEPSPTSTNNNNTNGSTEEAVDEFGRPLRPGREESSDSDSDRDYRYRRGRGGSRRDNDRYSPDRNRKRDHSPSDKRRGDRSPSPQSSYRETRRRRDEWDNRSSRNGHDRSPSPPPNKDRMNSSGGIGGGGGGGGSAMGAGGGRRMRGDIFEGGVCKTYKQFLDYQDDSITPTDAEKKYEEYRTEFLKRQARVFFKDHQTEEWFREKYDPAFLIKKQKEKLGFAKSRVTPFISLLKDDSYNFSLLAKDNIDIHEGHDDHEHDDDHHLHHHHHHDDEKDKMDEDKKENNNNNNNTQSKPQPLTTLFIKAISPTCTKEELLEVFNKVATNGDDLPVVTKLTLSEPMKSKNFYRLGWVTFKSSEHSIKALKELNGTKMRDFDLFLAVNKQMPTDTQKKFRVTPKIASTEQRISTDLAQATNVANLLDKDREINDNPLFNNSDFNNLSDIDKLDKVIHYLRYVHLFCYYCSEEYFDVDEIERKCGTVHYRRPLGEDTTSTTSTNNKQEPDENKPDEQTKDKNESENNTTGATSNDSLMADIDKPSDSDNQWVINLDNNIKAKIAKINNQEQYTCQITIEKSAEEFIQINTFKIEESKYRCSLCAKLFKGSEFVQKHIHLKHPEELKKDSEEKGTEEQFFLNYFSDPRKMTPPTANQQMMYGYQNPRMMARSRWNPALGQWEQPMVMMPNMMQPGQPQMMTQMYGGASPMYASPNVRGRGIPLPVPLPMRRGFTPGASPQMQGSMIMPNSSPSPNIRYRPYPSAGSGPRGGNPMPTDPRGIREYVDLDAPSDSMPDIDYRSALKDYQSKRLGSN